ncbi:MAG TPA: PEP/pyruvate-binding domain-containing protein [Prolixibacteraceae bacterium]|nr:PEP/pyruvate-binding domain-containing protein [Prolixibacteraceae bacterium]
MKRLLIYILHLLVCLLGQEAALASLVAGRVIDIATQGPVAGARINIPGTDFTTISAADGSFSIVTGNPDTDDGFYLAGVGTRLIWHSKNPLTFTIYSILGQPMAAGEKGGTGSGALELQFLTNGLYVLNYRVEGRQKGVKFIKSASGLQFPAQGMMDPKSGPGAFAGDSLEIAADGYYAARFKIQSGQAPYELLNTNGGSPAYLNKLPYPEAFELLQNVPFNPTFGEVESVKITYSIPDRQIYYMNSSRFFVHFDFAEEMLGYTKGHYSFNVEQYKENKNRIYYLGYLNHFKSSDVYTLEMFAGDEISCEGLRELYDKIAATSYIGNRLRFFPNNARWDRCSAVPRITSAELYEGQNYQPLNTGENYGYLKKVEADQIGTTYLGRHVLALINGIPNEISVVAGIITTDFQTPLSHINVLSHNRGTPNMALRDGWTNAKLEGLLDHLVYLKVTLDSFYVREATIAEAESFWARKEPTRIQKLTIDTLTTGLVNLAGMDYNGVPTIGGKAANFAELMNITLEGKAIPVPEGAFAIPISYYWSHMKNNRIDVALKEMLANPEFKANIATRAAMLTHLQQLIKDAPVDPRLVELIRAKIGTGDAFTQYRFRSSTNAEDIEGFNGAGLYNSYSAILGNPDKTIEEAIGKVWASLWSLKAFEEREYFKIDPKTVGMAILVHRSFPTEEANGVVITKNLFNVYNPAITINVQVGEMSIVLPENNYLPDQVLYYSFGGEFADTYNYLGHTTVPGMEGKTVMTPQELKTLNDYCKAIQNYYCRFYSECNPLDIEFKVDRVKGQRKIYIKQVRLY